MTNDFLMAALFIFFTLGIIGAYVNEFPLFPSPYMTEMAHKVAISSLLGMLIGMLLGLAFGTSNGVHEGSMGTPRFFLAWGAMTTPAYPLMVYFVSQLNKRDLIAEAAERAEKRKKRGTSNHPPILNKDGF